LRIADDEAVLGGLGFAQRFAVVAVVEAVAPAFLRQQAIHEGGVGFLVLRGGVAHGRGGQGFGAQLELEVGLRVGAQHAADDLVGALVEEDAAVLAQAEEVGEGDELQPVAGQAAVAAELGGLGDVAVVDAVGAIGLHQAQAHLLAGQGLEFEVGVGAQAVDDGDERGEGGGFALRAEAVDVLAPLGSFDHEGGAGEGGLELQQALLLADVQRGLQPAEGVLQVHCGNP
jgi:hypothetical protein